MLYQPAVPVLVSVAGFSKKTPMVAASEPKAAAMREDKPYPLDEPMTKTFFGPLVILPFSLVKFICSSTFISQPLGWVVVQIKPRILGLIIIKVFS